MPRYKLTIEYDGTLFHGWQTQENCITVQAALQDAVFKLCNQKVEVYGAGRTDAGVHATGQVAHIDLPKSYELYKIQGALNYYLLPLPIVILEVNPVPDHFHARFSATKRHYCYRIVTRFPPLALEKNRAWLVRPPLDIDIMNKAASFLIGTHDFSSFRSSECQAISPIKTLERLSFQYIKEDEIQCDVSAPSFLHHQVRNMVGTLVEIGKGKCNIDNISHILIAKDRTKGGVTAPACGLYLTKVEYFSKENLTTPVKNLF